jgi:hypothetical protein
MPHERKRSVFKPAKVALDSEYSKQKDEDLGYYNPGVQGCPSRCTTRVLMSTDFYDFRHGVLLAVAYSVRPLSLLLIDCLFPLRWSGQVIGFHGSLATTTEIG